MKRPGLRELARRLGILSEYVNMGGRTVRASDATREALLAVMGFEAPTEDAARGWLAELDHEERERMVEPVRVVAQGSRAAASVQIQLPSGMGAADVSLTVTEESGQQWHVRHSVRGAGSLKLPTKLPIGYHHVSVEARTAQRAPRLAEQSLIVVPPSCVTPADLPGARRVMGVVANLYSVRREHDWGVGDFGTLNALVGWAASRGAAFVGINPLHALFNRGEHISPYSPVSRLFRNHLYIDVEAVPELARCEPARAILNAVETRRALRALQAAPLVDYAGAITLKERVLTELHRTFVATGGERFHEYQDFVRYRDPELTLFATWMAVAEDSGAPDWRKWPEAFQSAESPSVRAFQAANAERVDFFRWLQFVSQQQLAETARRARAGGMAIGVYQDLAIGTSPGGSDTWSYPDLFLPGAAVGAPPDPYSATGQNWGLPPLSPRALRAQRYRYWIQLLRRAFEHAGALRIDHVMGLFRMFWIPEGGTGDDGAYVAHDAETLLGIMALESVRHSALVVGEDLGIVPKEVPLAMKKWGLLSSKVLFFEREGVEFKPARRYSPLALAVADTHDMAPLAGFWIERDIELRQRVGLLRTSAELRREKRRREREKEALLRRLELAPPKPYEEAHFPRRLTARAHEFLSASPSALVGTSLDDLTGETDPVNVPGVGQDLYPSWQRKTRLTMEEIGWSFAVDDAMRCNDRRAH
ncbi:MAG: 4-alpha-glucanotransferase [Gemmatimonadaceae bacterium]